MTNYCTLMPDFHRCMHAEMAHSPRGDRPAKCTAEDVMRSQTPHHRQSECCHTYKHLRRQPSDWFVGQTHTQPTHCPWNPLIGLAMLCNGVGVRKGKYKVQRVR